MPAWAAERAACAAARAAEAAAARETWAVPAAAQGGGRNAEAKGTRGPSGGVNVMVAPGHAGMTAAVACGRSDGTDLSLGAMLSMLTADAARAVGLQARLQETLQVHARVLLMRHSTRRRRAKRWSVGEAELQIAKAAGWNSQVDELQATAASGTIVVDATKVARSMARSVHELLSSVRTSVSRQLLHEAAALTVSLSGGELGTELLRTVREGYLLKVP